jgi:predicted nucleic acid-binding protein
MSMTMSKDYDRRRSSSPISLTSRESYATPNDDMILACAVAASASHVVTRDDDLLSLDTYEGITIITPEAFLMLLRSAG